MKASKIRRFVSTTLALLVAVSLASRVQAANFVRGDANGVGGVDMTDAMFVLNWKFLDGDAPLCEDTADVNDDGTTDMSDALSLLNFLFLGKTSLPAPYPECGADPTTDEFVCAPGVQYGDCENTLVTTQFFFPTEDNSDADGLITGRVLDEDGNPLRLFHVTHAEFLGPVNHYMTDGDGFVTIESPGSAFDGSVTVTIHAQNPVVKMLSDTHLAPPVQQNVTFADGDTVSIDAQSEWFSLADSLRKQYNNGLREFSPWGDDSFPNGSDWDNDPFILVRFPDVRTHVEPFGLTGGPPLIRLFPDLMSASVRRHELGHALHFSMLSHITRVRLLSQYLQWVVATLGEGHELDKVTTPVVAWVEGFAAFAGRYAGMEAGPDKHERFFEEFDNDLRGADVEGAILSTVFVDFARDPAVGLDYAVSRVIDCESVTIFEYADCVRNSEGEDSDIYQALLVAGHAHGIVLPGALTGIEPGSELEDIAEELNDQLENPVARDDPTGSGNQNGSDVEIVIEVAEILVLAPVITAVTIPAQANTLESVNFSVSHTGIGTTPVTVTWDFGNGGTTSGSSVTHSYFRPDTYTVTVSVRQGATQPAVASGQIVVSPPLLLELPEREPLQPRDLFELPRREPELPAGELLAPGVGGFPLFNR